MPGILCRWITRQEWYRRFFSDVYLQTGISGMVHQRQIITVRWGAVDALLGVLCALYCISGMRSGQAVSAVALENAFRYAVWYFCAKIFFSFNSGLPSILAFSAMCLWGVTESVTGLSQVFGHTPSGHAVFGMTGSFSNPGPYGGFVAMMTAVAAGYLIKHRRIWDMLSLPFFRGLKTIKVRRLSKSLYLRWILLRFIPLCLGVAAVVSGMVVLPATMSRAGWLALAVALALALSRETSVLKWTRSHKGVAAGCMAVAVALAAGAFLLKKDSASGRIHIWHIEARAIAAAPLTGTGPGTALGAYGRAQEAYFREGDRPETVIKVAGCPEFAFNEYLKIGMETGIPGMLLGIAAVAAALVRLLRGRSVFAYGLAAAAVFAFFSYPLSIPEMASCIAVLLGISSVSPPSGTGRPSRAGAVVSSAAAAAVTAVLIAVSCSISDDVKQRENAEKGWKAARQWSGMELYEEALEELSPLYPAMRWNFRYLYDYGYALHKEGRHEESIAVLSEGARISSDPMFHNIIGKCHEALGRYDAARDEYMTAHYMVPCRLYPLVLLMRMYASQGEYAKAAAAGNKLLGMPVNPKNHAMVKLKSDAARELEGYMDGLEKEGSQDNENK